MLSSGSKPTPVPSLRPGSTLGVRPAVRLQVRTPPAGSALPAIGPADHPSLEPPTIPDHIAAGASSYTAPLAEGPIVISGATTGKISAPTQPLGLFHVNTVPTYDEYGKWPSLADRIPGLTPKMERGFHLGYSIGHWGGDEYAHIVHAKGSIGDTVSVDIIRGEEGRRLFEIYNAWQRRAAFPKMPAEKSRLYFKRLKRSLEKYNITLSQTHEDPDNTDDLRFGGQYQLLVRLVELSPPKLLRSGVIKKITITDERSGAARFSAYEPGEVLVYKVALKTSVGTLSHIFLHEIGHAILGSLSPAGRAAYREFLKIIVDAHAIIAVDTTFASAQERRDYMSSPDEFLPETHALYVLAGDYLRREIEKIRDPNVKAAYKTIYAIMKRLHEGREFGGTSK